MPPIRALRLALAWLVAAAMAASAQARTHQVRTDQGHTNLQARTERDGWVAAVVTKISMADRSGAGGRGTVTIRVRVSADGALDGVSIDEGSGSQGVDARAIRAVRAAAPFRPPPKALLSLEGYTELAFPLDVGARNAR